MIVVFVAAFFCILNIALWIAFFSKFKKIFSTDDIIASTREQMENMIADINRNAGRNIELIEDRIRQLKAVVAEADRHVEVAKREIENQRNNISYQNKIDSVINSNKFQSQAGNTYSNISDALKSRERYELTEKGNQNVYTRGNNLQRKDNGELFSSEDYDNYQIVSKTGTRFTVENNGASYTSVPVIGGNISYTDEPVKPKKKFGELVRNLYDAGYSVEKIALELDSSTTEVQCVLDMGF